MSLVSHRLVAFVLVGAATLAGGCVIQENDVSQFLDSGRPDSGTDAASDAAPGDGTPSLDSSDDDTSVATDTATGLDAPAIDTAPETPPPCPYVLCEDFEKGTAPAGWTVEQSGGKASVQSVKVAHGKYAAQFHLDVGGQHARFVDKASRPSLEGHFFGRVYLYFDALPDPHSFFFTSGPVDGSHYEVGSYSGGYQLTWWKPGAEKPVGGSDLPKGKWWCLEFEIDDGPGNVTAWTDGTQGAQLKDAGAAIVGAMKERTLGFKTYATTTTAYDIYADDLVLDTKRINCL